MTPDARAVATATRLQWDDAAAGWDRQSKKIHNWLRAPTATMLNMAGIAAGQDVLDLAAGAGDQSMDVLERVGPSGSVTASDISEVILSFAASRAAAGGHRNLRTHVADAMQMDLPEARFDAAICRLGLMFLPDPLAGLKGVHRVLKPGARFCSMVFAGPEQNPCLRILMTTAMRHAGVPPRDPFAPGSLVSLGRQGHLDALYRDAGFASVTTTRMEAPFDLPSVGDYLDFVRDGAGPILQMLAPLDQHGRDVAWADMAEQLQAFRTMDGWSGPNTLLLTVGTR